MIKLYQFPLSHYCEKVRWALELKEVPYRKINLIPGPHVKKVNKIAPRSNVPVLRHGNVYVQESAEIISYLDQQFPQRPLTPHDPLLRDKAIGWERWADDEVGPAVRLLCYHSLLDHPDLLGPMLTEGMSWQSGVLARLSLKSLLPKLRYAMSVNDDTARQAEQQIALAVDKVSRGRGDREFLVGDTFTRADLAVASLLAPLIMPDKYGVTWPEVVPEPLQSKRQQFIGALGWIDSFYEYYR